MLGARREGAAPRPRSIGPALPPQALDGAAQGVGPPLVAEGADTRLGVEKEDRAANVGYGRGGPAVAEFGVAGAVVLCFYCKKTRFLAKILLLVRERNIKTAPLYVFTLQL